MNPISGALHSLVASDEASFRAAHTGQGLDLEPRARRARRVRLAARASLATVSAVVLAVSAVTVSSALRRDTPDPGPVAPPVPDGYERVVITLPQDGQVRYSWSSNYEPLLNAMGLDETTCDVPLPSLGDPGPFHLEVTDVWRESPITNAEAATEAYGSAVLTYDGRADGAVELPPAFWVILREDGTVAQGGGGVFIVPESLPEGGYSLGEPFSTERLGWLMLVDCRKATGSGWDSPWDVPEEVLLDPGSYSIVSIGVVTWSATATVILESQNLGMDPSWFREGWREAVPCRDDIERADQSQNGNAIECVPHLYYQQIPNVGDYAIVDVPDGFLTGPRKTWYVVSDPYPIELPLEDEPPTT